MAKGAKPETRRGKRNADKESRNEMIAKEAYEIYEQRE